MEAATEVVTSTPAPVVDAQVSNVSPDARDAVRPEGDALEGGDGAQAGETAAEKEKAALQKGVQRRIDKITRARFEAEARAKMLEERLVALESRQQQPAQQRQADDAEPRIEQFDNFDKYVQAKAEYVSRKLIDQTLSERERRQVAERAQTERASVVEAWNARVESATAEMPDFEDVITSSDVPMTEPMQQAIMSSDLGPKLAYYLASNQDEARKIAGMDPIGAIRALGRIEERLSKPAEKVTTSAPAPLKPVGGTAKVEKDPADMSQKEFNKWRNSVKAKR